MFTKERFADFIAARERGERCEIDQAIFDYFLDVLPPVFMDRWVTLNDGSTRVRAAFGFAEGAERVTAFWRARTPLGLRYFAQHTTLIARGG